MGFVYVLRSGNEHKFKIGLTRGEAVESRRRQLATGNPDPLTIFDVIETDYCNACETYLHRVLRSKRVSGGPREFFAIAPDELRPVIEEARAYIQEFSELMPEAQRLKDVCCNGEMKEPGNEDWSIYREIIDLRQRESCAQFRREMLESRLKISIGETAGIEGIATWKNVERNSFDEAAFKQAHPNLFEAFRKVSSARIFSLK